MTADLIRYDILAQSALRGVVRTVLSDAAKNGLPGEHHFKITFNTTMPGVKLSDRMRGRYPQEMTIVLQHQFWDLAVNDQGFEVGLSFGGVPERIGVPFDAISAFYDPAVQFGFQFEAVEADDQATAEIEGGAVAAQEPEAGKDQAVSPLPAASPVDVAPPPSDGGAEVVRLDRFRKK
jgi:hypothetical protein